MCSRRMGRTRTFSFAPAGSTTAASAVLPISRPDIAIPHKGRPDIAADDPMSEAGRKIMAYYLSRLLHYERLVREGDHTEAIHDMRSEEHTSELQSPDHLVCRLLLEKKKKNADVVRKTAEGVTVARYTSSQATAR